MKILQILFVVLLASCSFLTSCDRYELDFDKEIIARNFNKEMDENPSPNEIIGVLDASSSYTRISFNLTSQTPEGAIEVSDQKDHKGEISVADSSLFDFEKHQEIKARVAMFNPDNADTINVNIKLIDLDD
ncbi:hypothetical protein OAD66_07580 [Bacteroidia bacterium]|nr:hypothetical protein [Bacteroidia bacterium]MDB9882976.1 hypothetical protein [Bacteroidia bacterium]